MNTILRMLREVRDKAYDMERGFDFHWNCLHKAYPDPNEKMTLDDLDRRSALCAKVSSEAQKLIDELMKEVYS